MEFHKILVPVGGNSVDDDVVKLACTLAKRSRAKVCVVYVIQVQRSLPLDAEIPSEIEKAGKVLDHAQDIAEDWDYEVQTDLLQAREIGPAIVDEAMERGVDLILMGISYKKRFGVFNVGSVAPLVLKDAPCKVLLLRELME